MRLAFYAPMKPPDDPVPSGDRTIARALLAALDHLGAEVTIASRFRARDGRGDRSVQLRLELAAAREAEEIAAQGRDAGWQAWITYHNYYKTPDLIGPHVASALGIPYLLVEASRAKKRLIGRWGRYARLAEAACDAADVIFYASTRDAEALHRDAPAGQHLRHLRPFLTTAPAPHQPRCSAHMLSAGMMRQGDKLASYQIIAETLARLTTPDWTLHIAGDGPARPEVEALFAPFGDRITYLGQLEPAQLAQSFSQATLFLWPGVNEALGMVYLEAQAAGCPVVAQDRPGMREILARRDYPPVEAGAQALAAQVDRYLGDPDLAMADGIAAQDHVHAHHLLPQAAETLASGLALVGVRP